jgi:hypothetical protein
MRKFGQIFTKSSYEWYTHPPKEREEEEEKKPNGEHQHVQ